MPKTAEDRDRRRMTWVWACAALLGLPCCGDDDAQSPSEPSLRVGLLMPFSGDIAGVNANLERAARLAADIVNQSGGVRGRQLRLEQADSRGQPDTAARAMQSLIDQDIEIVVGPVLSESTRAVLEVSVPAQVLVLNGTSSAPSLTEMDNDGLFFRTAPREDTAAEFAADTIADAGHQRVAVLVHDSAYPRAIADALQARLESDGCGQGPCEVTRHAYPGDVDPATYDFAALLEKALEKGPDVLYFSGLVGDTSALLEQVEAQSYRGEFYVNEIYADSQPGRALDRAVAERLRWVRHRPASGDEVAWYAREYSRVYGLPPEFTARELNMFDAVIVLALALEAAPNRTPRAVADVLPTVANAPGKRALASDLERALARLRAGEVIDYEGLTGVEFDDRGDVSATAVQLMTYDSMGEPLVLRSSE